MLTETTAAYRLSAQAQGLTRSIMRELLRQASEPGVISLAGGLPDSALLPHEAYQDCLRAVLTDERGLALQYRPMYEPLRAWAAETMRARGVICAPDNILITNGNQQGLAILSRLFVDPGQPVVTEAFTFTGVQQATAGRGAALIGVPVDPQTGVDLDALEAVFQQRPRLAVLIPDFHNPLGVSIAAEKRARIAELAARYRVPLAEDDPYSALRFAGEAAPPIAAYDDGAGYVFYLGSFSKMLAPGLRLGWLVAPAALMPTLITLRESLDLESSALTQRAVYEFLRRDLLPAHLTALNAANRERRDTLLAALDAHLGAAAAWTMPEGGLFAWVTLHDTSVDTWALLPRAIAEQRVAYVPGGAFAVAGRDAARNTMRLNFSAVPPEAIREGVRRFAGLLV